MQATQRETPKSSEVGFFLDESFIQFRTKRNRDLEDDNDFSVAAKRVTLEGKFVSDPSPEFTSDDDGDDDDDVLVVIDGPVVESAKTTFLLATINNLLEGVCLYDFK